MALALIQTLYILLNVAWWIIIIQAILSWLIAFNVINTSNDIIRSIWIALDRLTEPLYRPIRRIMPDLGALDLSPMVVLLIIIILQGPGMTALATLLLR
ncbi:YggT family protein [Sphingobium nicotianae]|uniref:YggT family protein n=1 Tax=Sphingobium nicotianae TaxID=2782607 RepID=A0A9X1IPY2_9SPHN|nr:YggT family protein [Sphingobium nicotianae]MBT2186211.1 YggT family protein [Sphingobium nicotianae]